MHDRRNPQTGAAASKHATRPFSNAGDAVNAIARANDDYPLHLRDVPAMPPALYVRGRTARDDALAVAVVGARRATPYGVEMAERLAGDLARRGITIVSGLARGIDSAAHRGALAPAGARSRCWARGVDVSYPTENGGSPPRSPSAARWCRSSRRARRRCRTVSRAQPRDRGDRPRRGRRRGGGEAAARSSPRDGPPSSGARSWRCRAARRAESRGATASSRTARRSCRTLTT